MRAEYYLVMKRGYVVYRDLETGEVLWIASRNTLREARNLAESLRAHWRGRYLIRESTHEALEKPSQVLAKDRMHARHADARQWICRN